MSRCKWRSMYSTMRSGVASSRCRGPPQAHGAATDLSTAIRTRLFIDPHRRFSIKHDPASKLKQPVQKRRWVFHGRVAQAARATQAALDRRGAGAIQWRRARGPLELCMHHEVTCHVWRAQQQPRCRLLVDQSEGGPQCASSGSCAVAEHLCSRAAPSLGASEPHRRSRGPCATRGYAPRSSRRAASAGRRTRSARPPRASTPRRRRRARRRRARTRAKSRRALECTRLASPARSPASGWQVWVSVWAA